MKILLGKHAGFCYGVRRAVEEASALAERGVKCATLGPLIHNPQEVERLSRNGIRCVDSPEDVLPGETLILRSHGVAPGEIQKAEALGVPVVDLTCPHVSHIHRLAQAVAPGRALIIVGQADHPEVQGIAGWCRGSVLILGNEEEAREAALPDQADVVAQTTIRRETFEAVLRILTRRIPDLSVHRTICAATSQRQEEAERLSVEADAVLVVGGENSSNTRKLFETCRTHCPRTLLVQSPDDIPEGFAEGAEIVAVTAGASTPGWLLSDVLKSLRERSLRERSLREGTKSEIT